MIRKKSKRGGARPGAGRPRDGLGPNVYLRLPPGAESEVRRLAKEVGGRHGDLSLVLRELVILGLRTAAQDSD
jgi:hypothetical protein